MAAADLASRLAALSPHQRQLLDQRLAEQRQEQAEEPIAIVGMACRFPGADDHPAFLELLRGGVDAITEVPPNRWDLEHLYDEAPEAPGKMSTRWGGFLRQIDQMDCGFFGISPREAVQMDPQQRLLLEIGWEALEDAGIPPSSLAGSNTGVFVGIMTTDYGQTRYGSLEAIDAYAGSGNTHGMTANRLSYQLDLRGPSMAIDTACSSSLVAIHLACQSLRSGETDLALAGGVNVLLWPGHTVYFTKASLMAADGRCKTFDSRADGFVRGEGAGMVALKTLAAAQADGDHVLAVVRGSAINQDGRSNGLTAPNPMAQEAVLRGAYRSAGVSPGQVRYVEAHGTGTALGDPIETKALGNVLAAERPATEPCTIGSVKTNVGHLEAAAGIAGLIKAILTVRHRQIFPHLHFREPNPEIPFDRLPLRVATGLEPLPTDGPIHVGVSSFGFGGTNAHVVLESAPDPPPLSSTSPSPTSPSPDTDGPSQHLLALSAHSEASLQAIAQRYAERLKPKDGEPSDELADVCLAANTGRDILPYRIAMQASTDLEASHRLLAFAAGDEPPGIHAGHATTSPKIAFLFTGQGSQYPGMGRGLFAREPIFRQALETCDEILRPHLDTPLLDVLYPSTSPSAPQTEPLLDQTAYTQPALFALGYALTSLWRAWGIAPTAVLGHSIGEYTAAHVAGVVSLEDGLRLIAERGRLMQAMPATGGMVTVRQSPARLASYLEGHEARVSVAAINGPRNVVLSGDREALTEVVDQLGAEGVPARWLNVSHAFHSPLVEPMLGALDQAVGSVATTTPTLDLISNLSGAKATAETLQAPNYWSQHARQPVRFMAGIETLLEAGYEVFVEIGPKPTLLGMAGRFAPPGSGTWLPSLRGPRNDTQPMRDGLATLHALGAEINWRAVHHASAPRETPRRRVQLPTYPFDRQRYWLPSTIGEVRDERQGEVRREPQHETVLESTIPGRKLSSPALGRDVDVYESRLGLETLPFLGDHRLAGQMVMPGAALLIMATTVGDGHGDRHDSVTHAAEEIVFLRPLTIEDDSARVVQLIHDRARGTFQIVSRAQEEPDTWTEHATGQINNSEVDLDPIDPMDLDSIRTRCSETIGSATLVGTGGASALEIGPRMQWLSEVNRADGEAIARLARPENARDGRMPIHPGLVDSALRLLATCLPTGVAESRLYLPFRIGHYRQVAPMVEPLWAHATLRDASHGAPDGPGVVGDIRVVDDHGRAVIEIGGLEIRPAGDPSISTEPDAWTHEVVWQASTPPTAQPPEARHRWLIFADRAGLGSALADALRNFGGRTVEVYAGDTFERVAADRWQLDPKNAGEVERLLDEASGGDPWLGAVYLWSLDHTSNTSDDGHDETLAAGLFHLGQALAAGRGDTPPALWTVTRGGQAIDAKNVPVQPHQTLGSGLTSVLGRELSEVACRAIDLDPRVASDAQGRRDDARRLAAELLAPDVEDRIAFRAETRRVARLVHRPLAPFGEARRIRPDAVYLITGGLGSLGLHVARWLVTRGARHLVLCGRSAPSEAARDTIRHLESDGATVTVRALDVSHSEPISTLVREVATGPQPLAGVFHLAGVIDDALVAQQDWTRFRNVLAPKVDGAWHLHRATAELDLDLFVLFSSAAPMLSTPGQSSYAAANAFLDALAHHRQRNGLPALAIGWGPWADGGMAAGLPTQIHQQWREAGIEMIDPIEGLTLMDRMFASDVVQLSVLPITWSRYFATEPTGVVPPLLREMVTNGTASTSPPDATDNSDTAGPHPASEAAGDGDPAAAASFLDRYTAAPVSEHDLMLAEHVRATARNVLQLAADQPLDDGESLISLGLDSLMALELRNALQADLDQPLPGTLIFDQPTVGQIVAFLKSLL